jgi:hypothetical protein
VIRTAVFDEFILRTVARDRAACVLNLAAGLDTRPYRLDLPAELRWVEVDLPAILDLLPVCPRGGAGLLPSSGLGARRGPLVVGGGAAARPRALAAASGLGA